MDGLSVGEIAGTSIKLYALMTPPAVLSAFIGGTMSLDVRAKRRIALKASTAIFILGAVLYLWGANIFELCGFTLDAFRIGSGVLLMLTAISLMRSDGKPSESSTDGDISVVPLAIPLGMGPASIGAVMVMGAQANTWMARATGILSLFLAAFGIYILLRLSDVAGKLLHDTGILVLAKLTGLILAAIAAQVIFVGVANFLG